MQTRPDAGARLAYAHAAAAVSDRAREMVTTVAADPGACSFISEARGLLMAAHLLKERAVIVERSRGKSWEEIARALGLTLMQTLHIYGETCDRWMEGDTSAVMSTEHTPGTLLDDDPAGTAELLDAWCQRHREWWDPVVDRPVTNAL